MPMKLGVIGCGKQAPKHVDALTKCGINAQLVFADVDGERARKLAEQYGARWSNDPCSVIRDADLDAVDICTPTSTHYDLICAALDAGKHVFCEKPLCETREQAADLVRRRELAGTVGMVGYVYRFAEPFQHLYRLLAPAAEGTRVLGTPHLGLFRIGGRGSHQPWKHRAADGGGARNEMLVHMLDLAIWTLGAPRGVELLSERLIRSHRVVAGTAMEVDAEDFTLLRLTTADGAEVIVEADLLTPSFSQHVEVQGSNGSFFGSIQPHLPSTAVLDQAAGSYAQGKQDLNAAGTNAFAAQLGAFVQAIQGQPPIGFAGFEDTLAVMDALAQLPARESGTDIRRAV